MNEHLGRAVAIARAYGATRVLLFGSALDAPSTARDLDLAVEGVLGWDFFGLVAELEAALPVRVDVLPLDQMGETHFTRSLRRNGRVLFERPMREEADEA